MNKNVSRTSSEKPLLGAVLCCTSIAPEDRTRLADYAEQMGAEHKLDLTSDVTHLLVGSTDTPKYQYVAREREDVKVLRPEWVEAVRERWMEDRSLDMNALEAEYRVATLAGLRICITGFDDLTFRAQLQRNVTTNGGEYTGDLTKDVTHLIAAKPEGKKYEYAMLWQKKVVSLQWYKDTLDRGMQLDESCYHPSRPAGEQGVGAWNREAKSGLKVGKRAKDEQPVQEPMRKLRRTASAKLGSQTDNMWGDIVGQPSEQTPAGRDMLRPAKSMSALRDETQQRKMHHSNKDPETRADSVPGFLNGQYFVVVNFDKRKTNLVQQTLQAAGAVVLASLADLFTHDGLRPDNMYLIVPHQTRSGGVPRFRDPETRPNIVTELWLERCMLQKAIIPPNRYPLGGVIAEIKSREIEDFTVNATGFQSIETLHIAKTVGLTGAKYAEFFTPKASVLVCNSMNINKQKLFHARQWKIPAVTESWLCKFLVEGVIPSFDDYVIEDEEDASNDMEAALNQKRKERQPRQSPEEEGRGRGSATASEQPSSAATPFPGTNASADARSKQEKSDTNQSRNQSSSQSRLNSENKALEDTALKEISPNSPSRRSQMPSSPSKKSLFRTFDGNSSVSENKTSSGTKTHNQEPVSMNPPTFSSPKKLLQDTASINSAIEDLLNLKAKARANASAQQDGPKDKKKRLLSRALSNLSNASHGSRHSRASSIDSLNTDGVGSEIAPPSGKSVNTDGTRGQLRRGSLQGQAAGKPSSATPLASIYNSAPIDPSDPHLLRDEFEVEEDVPQMTQLGYEDSEEAVALREKLAAKRRARGKLGQNEGDPKPEVRGKEREALKQKQKQNQVIKDDETLNATGWGGGRRTRAKNRSTDITDLELW